MSNLTILAKTPFITNVAGQQITLHPITLQGMGELSNFIKFKPFNDLKSQLDGYPLEIAVRLASDCWEKCNKTIITFSAEQCSALDDISGLIELIRISLRSTSGEAKELVQRMSELEIKTVTEIILKISGFVTEKKTPAKEGLAGTGEIPTEG